MRNGSQYVGTETGEGALEETGTQRSQKMVQLVMDLSMLEQRQVMPRLANDPLWLHNGIRRESGLVWVRAPPPP